MHERRRIKRSGSEVMIIIYPAFPFLSSKIPSGSNRKKISLLDHLQKFKAIVKCAVHPVALLNIINLR